MTKFKSLVLTVVTFSSILGLTGLSVGQDSNSSKTGNATRKASTKALINRASAEGRHGDAACKSARVNSCLTAAKKGATCTTYLRWPCWPGPKSAFACTLQSTAAELSQVTMHGQDLYITIEAAHDEVAGGLIVCKNPSPTTTKRQNERNCP